MKKIDLSQENDKKAIVDDELLLEHNQTASEGTDSIEKKQKDSTMLKPTKLFIVLTVIAVLAGVGTGFGSFRLFSKPATQATIDGKEIQALPSSSISAGDIFGSPDASFDNDATGYLEEGGLEGEGSHKLLRPGGVTQTVYLTSSVTDLNEVVGMEVTVWGETFQGQKAGWLMDVGRVEVINTDAQTPEEK